MNKRGTALRHPERSKGLQAIELRSQRSFATLRMTGIIICLFSMLALSTQPAHAEYGMVYSSPDPYDIPTRCDSCYKKTTKPHPRISNTPVKVSRYQHDLDMATVDDDPTFDPELNINR